MITTEFDADEILADFLSAYIENSMEDAEREAFEEYLDKNPAEKEFTRKALMGRNALRRFANEINNSAAGSTSLSGGNRPGTLSPVQD